jgi:hypothetical protein
MVFNKARSGMKETHRTLQAESAFETNKRVLGSPGWLGAFLLRALTPVGRLGPTLHTASRQQREVGEQELKGPPD